MASKHEQTLREVFAEPTRANIVWVSIESMLKHYGCYIEERSGSRVGCDLNGAGSVFHRPHPGKEAGRRLVRAVREFCIEARLTPKDIQKP